MVGVSGKRPTGCVEGKAEERRGEAEERVILMLPIPGASVLVS